MLCSSATWLGSGLPTKPVLSSLHPLVSGHIITCPAGEAAFLLSDLLTASGQTLALPLKDAHGRPLPGCTAVLSAEELPNTNAVVTLALAAQRLENKDTFGKSDPFLKISKARENGAWAPVVKSEVRSAWATGRHGICEVASCLTLLLVLLACSWLPCSLPLSVTNALVFLAGGQQQPEPHLAPAARLHGLAVPLRRGPAPPH